MSLGPPGDGWKRLDTCVIVTGGGRHQHVQVRAAMRQTPCRAQDSLCKQQRPLCGCANPRLEERGSSQPGKSPPVPSQSHSPPPAGAEAAKSHVSTSSVGATVHEKGTTKDVQGALKVKVGCGSSSSSRASSTSPGPTRACDARPGQEAPHPPRRAEPRQGAFRVAHLPGVASSHVCLHLGGEYTSAPGGVACNQEPDSERVRFLPLPAPSAVWA